MFKCVYLVADLFYIKKKDTEKILLLFYGCIIKSISIILTEESVYFCPSEIYLYIYAQ